jgi:outer membrane protein assembly factor BamA
VRRVLGLCLLPATVLLSVLPGAAQQQVDLRDVGNPEVERIRFEHLDAQPIGNRELRAAMLTQEGQHFERRLFRGDLSTIENLYRGRGYMDVDVVRRTFEIDGDGRLRITLKIDSGDLWSVARVELRGGESAVVDTALARRLRERIKVTAGAVFRYGEVVNDERALLGWLNSQGYAHARVRNQVDFDARRRRASVVYTVTPGRRMYFGPVTIAEDSLYTRTSLLRRQFTFAEGELYDPEKLRATRNNLSRTGLFRSVTLATPALVTADSVQPVVLRLQERKFIHLRSRVFVNSSEPGISGRVQHANFLGRGNRIGADASLGQPLQGLTLFLTERNFLRSTADLTLSAGVTDEWGDRRVFADPGDSLQYDLLARNYSIANELDLLFGREVATALLANAVYDYPSIERLWQVDAVLSRRWELGGGVTYASNVRVNATQSRNRPIGGERITFDDGLAEMIGPPAPDDGSGDDGFPDDGGFPEDGGFDDGSSAGGSVDGGFPEDPFASGRRAQGAGFAYDDNRIDIDDTWVDLLTNEAKAVNFELDLSRDTRDNTIAPTRGSFVRAAGLFAVELGGRRTRVLDGDLEARHYLRIGGNVVWAQAARGVITGTLRRESDLPQAYWKSFGGEGSVRGVRRESIQAVGGGRGGLVLRNELRVTAGSAGIVVFWDRAGVWRRVSNAEWKDMTNGYGLGLRYDLGIPARLDLGWRRGSNQPQVYLSVGQAF